MLSATEWVAGLSPWPADGFGLERIQALLEQLGNPQRVFRAWSDPEELVRWLPTQIEGALAVGTRSTLVWPDTRRRATRTKAGYCRDAR